VRAIRAEQRARFERRIIVFSEDRDWRQY